MFLASPSTSTSSESKIISIQPENIQSIFDDLKRIIKMNKFILDTIHSICIMEQENVDEPEEENIFDIQQFVDTSTHQNLPNIIEEFSTPDLNEPESNTSSNEVLPLSTDEIIPKTTDEVLPILMKDTVLQAISEVVTGTTNELLQTNNDKVPLEITNEVVSTIPKEENAKPTSSSSSSSSSPPCITLSPDVPPLDDEPVLLSTENPQASITDTSDINPQDYIIIVPCSDDEDDIDDDEVNDKDTKVIESSSSVLQTNTSPLLINPSPVKRGNLLSFILINFSI